MMEKKKNMKDKKGKLRYSLLMWEVLDLVVKNHGNGAIKYSDFNWQNGEMEEYLEAANRHISKVWQGQIYDPEFNDLHLVHAITDLMFATWLQLRRLEKEQEEKEQTQQQ